MSVYRRHVLAPLGIGLTAYGLADHLAFFSPLGATMIVAGALVLGLAAIAPDPPDEDHMGYPALLVALALLTSLVPLVPGPRDPLITGLTFGAAVVFYACGALPPLRRYRLLMAAALIIAAHAVLIVRVPVPPHQDVWRFLNFGVDALLKGHNPYGDIRGADGLPIRLTYPPGVILLLAPLRALAGDVRWGYIICEAVVVMLLPLLLRRLGVGMARWREALILIPLVLPRSSQAFFIFSNQEWLLLALALAGLLLALDRRWLLAGAVLGVGIASKQYFIVFPVLFLLPVLRRQTWLSAIALAAALTLPFVVWGPGQFWNHVFGNLNGALDPDRVTASAMLVHVGLPQSRMLSAGLAVVGSGAALALAWAGRKRLDSALMACGLGLFAFTLGATFAGYNYYVYGLVFICWGLLLPKGPLPTAPGTGAAKLV